MIKKVVYFLIFCLFNFSSVISMLMKKKLKIKIQNLMCLLECLILVIMVKDQL